MPRKPRFFLPNVPVHMIVRGNNRQAVFAEADTDPFNIQNGLDDNGNDLIYYLGG